jgi:UDP-galactopyranose mutase
MYLVVGAGISGATIAERLAKQNNKKVLIIEKRTHISGNCYDYTDPETGILMNKYGAHLFHTNNERVWNYITKFGKWQRWDHTVLSNVDKKIVPVPINITTVNTLCETNLQTTKEMDEWLANTQVKYPDGIKNSEEMALSRVGHNLYEKMFKPYTIKQWNKEPNELDPSVLGRIPIYNSFDTRYFQDKFQALPSKGYTYFVEQMLNHPNIETRTGVDFFKFMNENDMSQFEGIIYTGPIDHYFKDTGLPPLEYRSIDFHIERKYNYGYFQPNSVVNYPEVKYPYTRIIEYKHFLHQTSPHTVIVYETTNDTGEPYYPIPNEKNMKLYEQYKALTANVQNVHFIGRLANYKYFNMDQAILNALEYFDRHFTHEQKIE